MQADWLSPLEIRKGGNCTERQVNALPFFLLLSTENYLDSLLISPGVGRVSTVRHRYR